MCGKVKIPTRPDPVGVDATRVWGAPNLSSGSTPGHPSFSLAAALLSFFVASDVSGLVADLFSVPIGEPRYAEAKSSEKHENNEPVHREFHLTSASFARFDMDSTTYSKL